MKWNLALIAAAFISPICSAGEISGRELQDFYLVTKPSQRMENDGAYFSHEFRQINNRRENKDSSQRPKNLSGLALSGGGIRSSAYQLGLLAGLNKSDRKLRGIDYISSVSGGSWANGAYWAWTSPDEDFFDCLYSAATTGEFDCDAAVMLNSEQPFAALPVDGIKLKARKRQWKDYIENIYLPECNVNAEEIEKNGLDSACATNYREKPYIIINASHSVPMTRQSANERNMPFQFTLDEIGTLADCHASESCRSGFFVSTITEDFSWINKALLRKDEPENSLSAALAASSGVVGGPVLLSYEYELIHKPRKSILGNSRGSRIREIREEFSLSDGGKSDNLGLTPLIERGVDLILISYMGKDSDLEKNPWEDLDLAAKQVKNLLNCEVEIPPKNADLSKAALVETNYNCSRRQGKILHIKATYKNAEPFIKHLRSSGSEDLADYLTVVDAKAVRDPRDRFPQTRTLEQAYDERLIRAYFLMGYWVATTQLNPLLNR